MPWVSMSTEDQLCNRALYCGCLKRAPQCWKVGLWWAPVHVVSNRSLCLSICVHLFLGFRFSCSLFLSPSGGSASNTQGGFHVHSPSPAHVEANWLNPVSFSHHRNPRLFRCRPSPSAYRTGTSLALQKLAVVKQQPF